MSYLILTSFSLVFQKETIEFAQVKPLVESCIKLISDVKTNPGPALTSTESVISWLVEEHQISIPDASPADKKKFQ